VQHAQKLESLGVLAGGIAHDFNNLLVAILGNADLALLDLPADAPAAALLERIKKSAERAADLTRQMLSYAGKARVEIGPVRLSRLVADIGALLASAISKKALVRYDLDENLPSSARMPRKSAKW